MYTFFSRLIYDVYYSTHLSLSVERIFFCWCSWTFYLGLENVGDWPCHAFPVKKFLLNRVCQIFYPVITKLCNKSAQEIFPRISLCTTFDGSDHCEHYIQKMTEKLDNYLTKEMCDQISIIAGENKMLAEILVILDKYHGQTGNVNCHNLPLGKNLPNKDQVEQLFKIGRRYGNVLIEWLEMKTLYIPTFVMTKWATLLVDIHCPRGGT